MAPLHFIKENENKRGRWLRHSKGRGSGLRLYKLCCSKLMWPGKPWKTVSCVLSGYLIKTKWFLKRTLSLARSKSNTIVGAGLEEISQIAPQWAVSLLHFSLQFHDLFLEWLTAIESFRSSFTCISCGTLFSTFALLFWKLLNSVLDCPNWPLVLLMNPRNDFLIDHSLFSPLTLFSRKKWKACLACFLVKYHQKGRFLGVIICHQRQKWRIILQLVRIAKHFDVSSQMLTTAGDSCMAKVAVCREEQQKTNHQQDDAWKRLACWKARHTRHAHGKMSAKNAVSERKVDIPKLRRRVSFHREVTNWSEPLKW